MSRCSKDPFFNLRESYLTLGVSVCVFERGELFEVAHYDIQRGETLCAEAPEAKLVTDMTCGSEISSPPSSPPAAAASQLNFTIKIPLHPIPLPSK